MGFFNSIFKGIGFKSDNQTLNSQEDEQIAKKYSDFDKGLANSFSTQEFQNASDVASQIPNLPNGVMGKNLVIYAPKDNNDIKLLIECLRRRESCIVNLAKLRPVDADRILQFVSGAVYALKGSIKRLQGDLFLIVPEGINIMTQKNK